MKIIQLIYTLGSGGAEKFVVNLSNELAKSGHNVLICMIRDSSDPALVFNKQFLRRDVKFHSMDFDCGFSIKKSDAIESFIKSENADVVHCHLNVIPYVYRLALCNRNIKFIHTIHSIASKASGLKIQYYLNKFFYHTKIIQPISISNECSQSFRDYYHLDSVCIENGCPPVVQTELANDVFSEIESYKALPHTPVFIHVGRCAIPKNQQLLIDAFNKLHNEGQDFVLLVIGSGFFEEQNKIFLDQACDKIFFLGEKKNVGDYLLYADAFCLTSIYEGLPISLIEAMSCGLTPICTSVGGIPDVVTDDVTGYLSNTLIVKDYLVCVKKYLNKPIEKNIVKQAFNERFTVEKCMDKYVKIYRQSK